LESGSRAGGSWEKLLLKTLIVLITNVKQKFVYLYIDNLKAIEMAKETSGGKIYVTFTIDKDVKKRFNIACATLGMNMSEVAQAMMENFIDISKSMENKELNRLNNLDLPEQEVEVVGGTRLKENNNG